MIARGMAAKGIVRTLRVFTIFGEITTLQDFSVRSQWHREAKPLICMPNTCKQSYILH